MTELTATVYERARAAQEAHTVAWQQLRIADRDGRWLDAAFWAETADACLEELDELAQVAALGVDADAAPLPPTVRMDGLQLGNSDLVSESALYPLATAAQENA